MKKSSLLVTIAGIMAALGGIPVLVATAGVTPPAWWIHLTFPLVLVGIVGTALLGVAAKGQDDHSTAAQIKTATIEKPAVEAQAKVEAQVAKVEAVTPGQGSRPSV